MAQSFQAPTIITDPDLLLDFARDFEKVILPVTLRKSYTNSRLLVPRDGGAPIPVLLYIAKKVFPLWDVETHYPFWKDNDWTHESLDNVGLASRVVPRPRRMNNTTGFPAGSPEYQKAYRQANTDRFRAANKRAYGRRRAAQLEARAAQQELVALKAKLAQLEHVNSELSPNLASLNAELERILVGGAAQPVSQTPTFASPEHETAPPVRVEQTPHQPSVPEDE